MYSYYGPLVTLACLAMLCRPFGDLSRVWLYYVEPCLTMLCSPLFGCVMTLAWLYYVFGYVM